MKTLVVCMFKLHTGVNIFVTLIEMRRKDGRSEWLWEKRRVYCSPHSLFFYFMKSQVSFTSWLRFSHFLSLSRTIRTFSSSSSWWCDGRGGRNSEVCVYIKLNGFFLYYFVLLISENSLRRIFFLSLPPSHVGEVSVYKEIPFTTLELYMLLFFFSFFGHFAIFKKC